MIATRRMQSRSASLGQHRPIVSLGGDVLTAVIALASCYSIRFFGVIPGPEIFLTLLAPVLLAMQSRRVLRGQRHRKILILFGIWLIAQIATDLYRGTAFLDWTRGDSSIIFFGLDFIGMAALLTQNDRRKVIFAVGLAIGSLAATKISPSDYFRGNAWKFGYEFGVVLLGVILSCYFFKRRQYLMTGFLLVFLIALNVVLNYRNPVLILMITLVLVLPVIPEQVGQFRILPPSGSGRRVVVLICIVLIGGSMAGFLVTRLAASGALGEEARAKNEFESQNKLGILIGGRPEILISSRAVLDSPILGHGSWARDAKYATMLADMMTEYGEDIDAEMLAESADGVIPSHSHLMGAWVSAGIGGAIFWVYIIYLTQKAIFRDAVSPRALTPLYIYSLIAFAWDIFFSPFGAGSRIVAAFDIILVLDILDVELPRVLITSRASLMTNRASRMGRLSASYPRAGRISRF